MIFELLGILSALLIVIADIPYFLDTIKGKTKPQRVTWGVVCALNAIGFANQYASGADSSLWFFGGATLATGIVFLASLRYGVGGHSRLDIFSIIVSLLGIVLWVAFDSPLLSILANLLVSIVALVPTFVKAKVYPETETKITWVIGSISSMFAALSVGKLDYQLLILPMASVALQLYVVYLLYFRPKRSLPLHLDKEISQA